MQYRAIGKDGSIISQSSSPYILRRKIKNYLIINRLKDSRLYYASEREFEKFIKKGGSDKEVSIRRVSQGRYRYIALSKSQGKRLFQSNSADGLAIEVCEYLKKREPYKWDFLEVEGLIKETMNVSNLEILKFNSRGKDAENFENLIGLSNKQTKEVAWELNTML